MVAVANTFLPPSPSHLTMSTEVGAASSKAFLGYLSEEQREGSLVSLLKEESFQLQIELSYRPTSTSVKLSEFTHRQSHFRSLHCELWSESQRCSDNSVGTRHMHTLSEISLTNLVTLKCKAAGSERSKSMIFQEAEAGCRSTPLTLGSAWCSPHSLTSVS